MKENGKYKFDDLLNTIDILLGENGCPWDREQTHETLKQYLIEECYEVIDAIDHKDMENLCEELGDVLFQVLFHSALAKKEKAFTLDDVVNGVTNKMIQRHKHIFGDLTLESSAEVVDSWENIKKEEKGYTTKTEILKSIPKSLPALTRAMKVQKKSSKAGFDFGDLESTLYKASMEISELKRAINSGEKHNEDVILEKYGSLLFDIVNISRFLEINPEFTLTNAIEKFINRFEHLENTSLSEQKNI